MLEEPSGNRSVDDEMVSNARGRLFESWETNWIAYCPDRKVAPVGLFMYRQA